MINEVRLLGNLGSDPDVRSNFSTFSMATAEKWKDKAGEWQEKTSWHRCVGFGYVKNKIDSKLKKGTLVYVEGSIEYSSFEKDGVTVYSTSIKVRKVIPLKNAKGNDDYNGPPPELYEGYGGHNTGDDVPF